MGRMLAHTEWDLIADNVAFIFGEPTEVDGLPALPQFQTEPEYLDLPRFVEGNISRPNSRRGELGFLKPVMSRAFLDHHGLRYDETLRLGEDYALYVRALAHGARFKVIKSCGYGAVVHATSLSSRHSAGDLAALANSDLELLVNGKLDGPSRAALLLHERHVRDRYRFRNFLDIKAARGVLPALSYGLGSQANVSPIATALFRARARWLASRLRHQAAETIPDFLLPGHVEAEPAEGSQ
jgi:succinoglycan biosynthesis protein ExoU